MNLQTLAEAVADLVRQEIADSPIPTADVHLRYMPIYDLSELTTCRVPVLPTERGTTPASRAAFAREHVIRIGPQWKANLPDGAVDELQVATFVEFVQWLDETIASVPRLAGHSWNESTINPLYDLEQLRESNMLTSLLTINYRLLVR